MDHSKMQDDHPDIKFWTSKQYQLAKKNQRKSTSIQDLDSNHNIMTWFVEEEDSKPVDNDTVKAMCAHPINLVQTLVLRNHSRNMGEGCNWKAHMITTLNYSSWYGKHIGHVMEIKMEPCIKKELKESAKQSAVDEALGTIKHKKAKTNTSKNTINKNIIDLDDNAQLVQSLILLKNPLSHPQVLHSPKSPPQLLAPYPHPSWSVTKPSKKAKAGHALNE
ncbi:hypothetical protein H0H87_002053, partial [Tephrocybe sp. NHM501043]